MPCPSAGSARRETAAPTRRRDTGETGVVRVEILAPPPAFNGSTRNGVTTSAWDAYPDGAFRFIVDGK